MMGPSERYDKIGPGYSNQRRPDQRISRQIFEELGDSESILNVGSGTGSYEPTHVSTIAVEPSLQMIRQRQNKTNVVHGTAEALPFQDASFDLVMAVLTIHHWSDLGQGLQECVRSSRRKVVILTWDPESPGFWLTQEYFPEILELDRSIFPSMKDIRHYLGAIEVKKVFVPADCVDGFLGAYWRRPEAYLQEKVRSAISSFSHVPAWTDRLEQLRKDLNSGAWRRAHGGLLKQEAQDLGYRLVIAVVD